MGGIHFSFFSLRTLNWRIEWNLNSELPHLFKQLIK